MVAIKNIALALSAALPALAAPATFSSGKYIITLKSDVESVDTHVSNVQRRHLARRSGGSGVDKVWSKYFKGYSGDFDAATIEEIAGDSEVVDVEEVQTWHLYALETQSDAPWGLASISSNGESGTSDYTYDDTAGEGTYAYIVDSGILTDHEDFDGRASFGYNAVGGSDDDTIGHGTHVAGTVAGSTFGVAKAAEVIAVKVFASDGSTTDIILDGFEWAVDDIISEGREGKSVINMSLGGGFSAAFNRAVDDASERGVLSVVAAGNENQDASNVSPASAESALTVGAIDETNARAYFSNYGSAVDIFAAGVGVESADASDPSGSLEEDGTSMASPHVAGLAIYLAALEGLSDGQEIKEAVLDLGVEGALSDLNDSPDLLAYNGADGSGRNQTVKA